MSDHQSGREVECRALDRRPSRHHFEKYPQLHQLFNEATKLAGGTGTKGSTDTGTAEHLLAKIDEIDKIFRETKS